MSLCEDDIEIPAPTFRANNGMVGGEGSFFDQRFEAHRAQLVKALADHETRREQLLADVDTFSDWLSAQCHGVPAQTLPRIAAGYPPFMESLPTPQIVALLLYPRADVQAAAMDELKARYLAAFGVEG
jgi:hypothetical protein